MKRLSLDEVKKRFFKIHSVKYDYKLFKNYKNNKEYIDIICEKHGVFNQRIDMHLRGQGCPICKKGKLSKLNKFNIKYVLDRFNKVHGDKYDYSKFKEYKGSDELIDIICKKHGQFSQSSRNHWKGQGCPKCYNEIRGKYNLIGTEKFIEKSNIIHNNKYDYSKVNYINSKTPVEIICEIHGSFFKRPNNHTNHKEGCPSCFSSFGEKKILSILKGNNIEYIRQKTFDDCRYINLLRFDFFIPSENLIIEYNGEQHYKPVSMWGGEEALKVNILKDKIKKEFCIKNNIDLLIISYNEKNDIFNILKNYFKDLEDYNDIYNEYINFSDAKKLIKKLGIFNMKEYRKIYKKYNLPSHPEIYIEWDGFINFIN